MTEETITPHSLMAPRAGGFFRCFGEGIVCKVLLAICCRICGSRYRVPDALELTFINKHAFPKDVVDGENGHVQFHSSCAATQDLLPQDQPSFH